MKGHLRMLALAGVFTAWLCVAATGDTLYLRNGEQEEGHIERIGQHAVVFTGREGEHTYKKGELVKLQVQRERAFDDVATVDEITDADLKACLAAQPSEQDFPAAGSVTLLERRTFDLSRPGVIVITARTITKVLEQRGEDAANQSLWYLDDLDEPDIDFALTITADGRVLHLSDAALKNESIHAAQPEYSRLSRYRFVCKEPRPGNILDVQTTLVRTRSGVLEPFYTEQRFRRAQPILRKEVILITRQEDEGAVAAGLDGPAVIQHEREVAGGLVRQTWSLSEPQRGIIPEPLMPPSRAFVPTLTLGDACDWAKAGHAYAEALTNVASLPPELAEKASALAAEGGVEAIHSSVARNVRTLPIPQWHYRIVPHAPAETAKRSLANALDKNFLYFKMLEAAGIDCAFALVRDREEGPLSDAVPSLKSMNTSAVYLVEQGIFSSAGSDVLAFDALPGVMQGAPALLAAAGGAKLTHTQSPLPEKELSETAFEASLDAEGTLTLAVTFSGRGNSGAWMRGMKDLNEEQLSKRMQQFAGYLHPAAVLSGYEVSDLADLSAPPFITLNCRIPGYAVKAGEELMLFDLPAMKYSAQDVGRPTREHGLQWDSVGLDVTRGSVRLPQGFRIYSTPKAKPFDSPICSYSAQLGLGRRHAAFRGSVRPQIA